MEFNFVYLGEVEQKKVNFPPFGEVTQMSVVGHPVTDPGPGSVPSERGEGE